MAAGGSSGPRSLPRDAKVIAGMLREMDVTDYEPRVINQLLEFSYKYIADVLEDAKTYSEYAGKKMIDREDVQLAIQMKQENSFSQLPPRELLAELARERNAIPLPPLKPGYGLRLPSDRYCLLQTNYKLKPNKQILIGTPRYPGSMTGAQNPGQTVARFGPPRNLSTMGGGSQHPSVVVSKQLPGSSSGFMPAPPLRYPGDSSGMGYGNGPGMQFQPNQMGLPASGAGSGQGVSGYGTGIPPSVSSASGSQQPSKVDGTAARAGGAASGGRSLFRIISGDPPSTASQSESRKRKLDDAAIDEDYDQF